VATPRFPWIFPYVEEPVSRSYPPDKDTVLRPVLDVVLVGRTDTQRVAALVDSGTEDCIVGRGLARVLGIEPDGSRATVLGIGGKFRQVEFTTTSLRLLPPGAQSDDAEGFVQWDLEVGCPVNWEPPWQVVLGQIGFFDKFTVTINRFSQAIAITEQDDFDRRYGYVLAEEERRRKGRAF
jgi:hypothetical protein